MNSSRNKSDIKVLFFTPHADDIELGVPFMYLEALRLGNKVVEVVMTNNEYGTRDKEFKGNRLKDIRISELTNANKVFERAGGNQIKVVRMDYVDGHLPLNSESVEKISSLINKEQPEIIFAPDPWFAQDYHIDHLNTGRLVYFAVKRLKPAFHLKKLFYYYSTKTHYYLKCNWKDFKTIEKALCNHKSQYTPIETRLIMYFYNRLSILRHRLETGNFSESFREQKFIDGIPIFPPRFEEMSFRERMIYYLFSNITILGFVKFYNISPKELGLQIDYNTYDFLRSKDRRYKYKFERNG
jgi:LmbE family N-acetylglucosaminyl deacetylase